MVCYRYRVSHKFLNFSCFLFRLDGLNYSLRYYIVAFHLIWFVLAAPTNVAAFCVTNFNYFLCRDEKSFTDVTIACDGQSTKAHKMILSACSPYFKVKTS